MEVGLPLQEWNGYWKNDWYYHRLNHPVHVRGGHVASHPDDQVGHPVPSSTAVEQEAVRHIHHHSPHDRHSVPCHGVVSIPRMAVVDVPGVAQVEVRRYSPPHYFTPSEFISH